MLADAIRSETYRLLQNRTAVFWSVFFVPIAGLAISIISQLVIQSKAVKINGADPDFHRRDLYQAIGTSSATTCRSSSSRTPSSSPT